MKRNKNLLSGMLFLLACAGLVWLSTSIQGSEKTYEIEPYIIPEYRTDAARAIDAYERLMERQMNLTEKNLINLNTELKNITEKLASIDTKLMELSIRMTNIEKKLGTEQAKELPAEKTGPAGEQKKNEKAPSH
jgi:septal ring factor EnvC (AmiA/AmiB activator)